MPDESLLFKESLLDYIGKLREEQNSPKIAHVNEITVLGADLVGEA